MGGGILGRMARDLLDRAYDTAYTEIELVRLTLDTIVRKLEPLESRLYKGRGYHGAASADVKAAAKLLAEALDKISSRI